ncbi:toxin-antitoxin system HicB family antitoxin [Streptomyces sp. SID12501]|uniref:Toxin-antitoxin system HicB family antitoxin n=1 Tax=Streptomyces sp. SID12501 TaxID=2706042 RepID=A0A6B3BPD3_9ACTN|nr:toxin-antitoxin system HicB family antitoxin [Streptomyces sp. SID12501]
MNLRLPDDVHELAVAAASADDRSLNSWLIAVVRRAAESSEAPNHAGGDSAIPAPLHGSGHSPRP